MSGTMMMKSVMSVKQWLGDLLASFDHHRTKPTAEH